MNILLSLLCVVIFIKSLSYGIYEIRAHKNTSAGIAIIATSAVAAFLSIYILLFRDYM